MSVTFHDIIPSRGLHDRSDRVPHSLIPPLRTGGLWGVFMGLWMDKMGFSLFGFGALSGLGFRVRV